MTVIFAGNPQPPQPGDILLSRFDCTLPVHWLIAAATRSLFCHATMVIERLGSDGEYLEWSTTAGRPVLRRVAMDHECWLYRANDANASDIGRAASAWLLERYKDVSAYDWEGAGFVGVQALIGVRHRSKLANAVPYCFEGVTDAYWQIGFDVVPSLEPGAVLGADIAESAQLVRL